MKNFIIIAFFSFGLMAFSCTSKQDNQHQDDHINSDTITEVPDENVRPTGDSRSTENVDLDTTNKSNK